LAFLSLFPLFCFFCYPVFCFPVFSFPVFLFFPIRFAIPDASGQAGTHRTRYFPIFYFPVFYFLLSIFCFLLFLFFCFLFFLPVFCFNCFLFSIFYFLLFKVSDFIYNPLKVNCINTFQVIRALPLPARRAFKVLWK
jgi:hypothetical protein